MASLRSAGINQADPQLSFNLEIIGYKKLDEKPSKDWLEVRLWVEAFGQKLQLPGKGDMSIQEAKTLTKWLREILSGPETTKTFQTFHEPLLSIIAVLEQDKTFEVTTLISAYGVVPGSYGEDEGVALKFRTDESSIKRFAEELEREMKGVSRRCPWQTEATPLSEQKCERVLAHEKTSISRMRGQFLSEV